MFVQGAGANSNRLRAKATITLVLAIVAAVILVMVVVRSAGISFFLPAPNGNTNVRPIKGPIVGTARALFTDITATSGIAFQHDNDAQGEFRLPEEMGAGGAMFDYDNDSDMDIYLIQGGRILGDNTNFRNRLYRNDGAGRFTDVSTGSGADVTGYGMGCAAADYDNDGDVDLYVTRLGSAVLLRNDGDGKFTDVTKSAGVDSDGFNTSAAFFDFDRDGFLDLYVARYADWSPTRNRLCYSPGGARDYCDPSNYGGPTTDRLFHNRGDGTYENVSEKSGISSAQGNGMGVLCADMNNDGWLDINVSNDQTPAFLWINQKNGTFLEKAAMAGVAYNADGLAIAGMGIAAEDFDVDGDDDLLVMNIARQPHTAYRNDAGVFQDVTHAWGLSKLSMRYTAFGIALFDQDHDGQWDGIIGNGAVNLRAEPQRIDRPYAEPNQFIRRGADGLFADATSEAGTALTVLETSRATIMGDIDNDGDVDVLITNNGGPVQLLRNDNQNKNSWVALDLIDKHGGRHALNALVELSAGGKTNRRSCRPHAGYMGSNDPRVHIGLGSATAIERVVIIWPDGAKEEWRDLPVNSISTIRQGASPSHRANGGA